MKQDTALWPMPIKPVLVAYRSPRERTTRDNISRLKRGTLACALATLLPVSSAQMQEPRSEINVSALGPKIGQAIPDFSLPDQNGTVWTRDSIMGPHGAMILFHRSADW